MSDASAIEWTDATWNPTTGCTKVSPGCAHCYIERTPAFRIPGNKFVKGKTDISIFHDRLEQPLHWRKPRRIFVNSLSDLFHDDISDAFIGRVFGVMAAAHWHTFQLLTKRADRMLAWSRGVAHYPQGDRTQRPLPGWPPNVWLGVSVENQHFADARIPLLLQTPAAVRFISAEPLLGPVKIGFWLKRPYQVDDAVHPSLNWVIVGGESGPGARPFDLAWGRSIVAQCQAAGVPVFVKQLGTNPHERVSRDVAACEPLIPYVRLRDRKGGDIDEWPEDLRVREYPGSRMQP